MLSFIIITRMEEPKRLEHIINSIFKDNNSSEVIVVDEKETIIYTQISTISLEKDFTEKPSWITAKKNYGTELASRDILVFLHDYIEIEDGFYNGIKKFGVDWDVSMCKIENSDGSRYMDNLAWDDPKFGPEWTMREKWCSDGKLVSGRPSVVSYSYNKTQHIYVPGYFWIAKRQFMRDNPLNEELIHCDAEDVEWSYRVRDKWNYKFNEYSTVKLLKYKVPALQYIGDNLETN